MVRKNSQRRSDRNRNSNAVSTAVMEAVESRKMFAATAALSGGVLNITGTASPEYVSMSKSGTKLNVWLNVTLYQFNYSSVNKIKADLKGGNDSLSADSTVAKPMDLHGGSGNDTFTGGAGDDSIYGSDGNDSLTGGWGKDSLYGGNGRDTFRGGLGNDRCFGGNELDYFYDDAGSDKFFGDNGNDIMFANPTDSTESDEFWGGSDFDYIFYTGRSQGVRIATDDIANDGFTDGSHGPGIELDNVHSDIEFLSGTEQADGIYAYGNHDNVIQGNGGDDYLMGGPGSDTIYGNDGNDWIFGEAGQDSMYGGNGNDTLYANASDWFDLCDGGAGTDTAIVDLHYGVSAETHVSIEIWHG